MGVWRDTSYCTGFTVKVHCPHPAQRDVWFYGTADSGMLSVCVGELSCMAVSSDHRKIDQMYLPFTAVRKLKISSENSHFVYTRVNDFLLSYYVFCFSQDGREVVAPPCLCTVEMRLQFWEAHSCMTWKECKMLAMYDCSLNLKSMSKVRFLFLRPLFRQFQNAILER